MENKTYSTYESPRLEVIDVKIEKGFAVTDGTENLPEQPW